MSTIGRTIKNILKTGPKDALHQMNNIGDTKWGALIGVDRFGNKYFENNDEISGRERWVDFASVDPDAADIDPAWHMWLARIVQEPPTAMDSIQPQKWWTEPTPNFTGTRSSFRTYSTTKAKVTAWEPTVRARQ
ncbi:nadh-ubiquinone oxidoreductase subunit [Lichtheimia corymbifera JMRC:FSU:9682]|uniref:NADH dehydrogenase [ubiquinone] 1 alpha subcomplex subunit n=1 Tax=Lichtheimia corymbifera JMRC:FSU:9682 TaxID=1263082 RepID=A0A068RHJ9_9FUNG|nr:nadh-ubiquinone oxidoreductase subunit [Lichtheimia corymbifera JMRC:FSU:9682]